MSKDIGSTWCRPPSSLLGFQNQTPVEGRFTKYFRRMSKQMLDERIRRYKDADINKISYKIRTGKIVDAIVHQSEETDCDLIVMASSKIIL